ncbi:MAG: c-type cytochrome biogenesis protein CcmI [Alphaproteobacteria bacterium]
MILWFTISAITLSVVIFLLIPLLRKQTDATTRVDYDIAVYRDQLAEIDKDIERELLTPEEAASARAEIQRRMLAAQDSETATPPNRPGLRGKLIPAFIILILMPLGAGLLYFYLGSPELPAKPFAERKNDPEFILANSAQQMAAQLEKTPDIDGYKQLAGIYSTLHFYDQAAGTYQKIIEMKGADANVWAGLGEALFMLNTGQVTPDARGAFSQALQLDPHDPRTRFYMGLAEAQTNEPRRAVAIWRDLEKDSPPDAPWLPILQKQMALTAKQGGFDPASIAPEPATPAPPADAAAILSMNPSDQNAMIHKMVNRLAAKMKDNPNDLDGWERLAKAYSVLGETDKAKDAQNKADALKAKAKSP